MKPALLFLITIVFLSSCRKNLEAGITTTITGTISDTLLNFPVAGARVRVVEYASRCFLCRSRPTSFRDSAISDAQGNYTLTFTTTGQGSDYFLAFEAPAHYAGTHNTDLTAGKDTTINISVQKLKWLKAGIKMDSVPYKPLMVYTGYTAATIHNFPADTTVYLEVAINRLAFLSFRYQHPDSSWMYYSKFDTFTVQGITDTTVVNYTLDASTFRYR
jgi:hypothetical protein